MVFFLKPYLFFIFIKIIILSVIDVSKIRKLSGNLNYKILRLQ